MRYLLIAVMLATFAALATGKPERQSPRVAKHPSPVPFIGGCTNQGIIQQDGRKITISGWFRWTAEGIIREDGQVEVVWFSTADIIKNKAWGVYRIHGRNLIGHYGYTDTSWIDDDGIIKGTGVYEDRLIHKENEE